MLKFLLGLIAGLILLPTFVLANQPDPYPPSPYDATYGESNRVPNLSPGGLPIPSNAPIRNDSKPLLTEIIYPGSIKNNVERIAAQFGWPQVVWNTKFDYRWVGKTEIHGNNLQGILDQLLAGYPLQAILYEGNHILAIYPRYLK